MTELKIKQADINNNGNQRLMGEIGGRGETQNMYHVRCGCMRAGGGAWGGVSIFWSFFLLWKYVKYETWMQQ